MRILTPIFYALLLALPALAEEIPSSPGWILSSSQGQDQEENVYGGNQRTFYSLKPPDQRPAISVDAATADRLRRGEMPAEAAYMGQGASPKKEEDEFVYGNHGNGIQMAAPVNSTLTGEEGRKDVDYAALTARTRAPASSDSGGSLAAGMGSSNNAAGRNVAAKALSMGGLSPNTARVGSPESSGASSAAPAVGGGGAAAADPRAIAAASPSTIANPTTIMPSVAVNNVASGFGMATSSSTGTNFSVWPNGDPATATATSTGTPIGTCGTTLTFSAATLQRFTMPPGCSGIKIDAFGAGGGMGNSGTWGVASPGSDGGGGAFVHAEGPVDGSKYDLVVVVGSPGGDAKDGKPGEAGYIGGGAGGAGGGGGGGGYSGIFLVDKARFQNGEMPQLPDKALVVAAGGGGGSAAGGPGGPGGDATGGGALGATQTKPGPAQGNGLPGNPLRGGSGGSYGGGGGGGYWGGGGGGGGAQGEVSEAEGGGGGSSFYSLPTAGIMTAATGTTAGNGAYPIRGEAGNAGKTGLVVVTFY